MRGASSARLALASHLGAEGRQSTVPDLATDPTMSANQGAVSSRPPWEIAALAPAPSRVSSIPPPPPPSPPALPIADTCPGSPPLDADRSISISRCT
ncbi:hypothetical protein NL676_038738 [Syzygium grande]|nr:hypothetical protein NL676_038738 [Syzygium grande]